MKTWRDESNRASFSALRYARPAGDPPRRRLRPSRGARARRPVGPRREGADGGAGTAGVAHAGGCLDDAEGGFGSRGGSSESTSRVGLPRSTGSPSRPGATSARQTRGAGVAVLERNFGDFYGLPASGSVRLAGGAAPALRGPGALARVLPGLVFGQRRRLRRRGVQLRGPVRPACDRPGHRRPAWSGQRAGGARRAGAPTSPRSSGSCEQALRRSLPGSGTDIVRGGDENAYRVLYKDAEGDQKVYNVFALLLLGRRGPRGLQPHQPNRGGAAAGDRDRDGARGQRANAGGSPDAAGRRDRGARGGGGGGHGAAHERVCSAGPSRACYRCRCSRRASFPRSTCAAPWSDW